ncbi:MAG: O-antigen ligase family protein [Candidatus Aminicenantaceae bacterium]
MIYTCFQKKEDIVRANYALLASAYLSSLKSLFYYFFKALPGERITGFMGHYMTQAGLLLLFSCLALSIFVFSHKKIKFLWAGGLLLALVALSLTLTRSAWVGLVAAAFLILLLYKPLTLVAIPLMIGIFFLVSPRPLKQRAFSIFSLKNHTNQQRIEYIRAGIQIIKDFPYFGTGPDTVEMVFQNPKYGLSEESKRNVHLHNNIIQIAAERGIQTLLIWLTFITWTFISLARLLHNKDPSIYPIAVAAMAAVVALFTAGLFEYNFADSEITALFLYLITIPFTLSRIQKKDRSNPTFHDERT